MAENKNVIFNNLYHKRCFLCLEPTSSKPNCKRMIGFKQYVTEVLKKVDGKWALVSKKDPRKVLQYYDGEGKPDQEWVNKVERRIQYFKRQLK